MKKTGKTITEMRAANPNFDRDLEVTFHLVQQAKDAAPQTAISALVTQRQQLRAYIDGEVARLSEFLKPYREQMQKLDAEITAMMTQQGLTSMKTETGTAILSQIDAMSIIPEERDAYIDWCLEHWNEFGGEMMQIGAPKVAAVRSYMESHDGHLPPHVKKETSVQFSIRKA